MDTKATLNNTQKQPPQVKPTVTLDGIPRVRAPKKLTLTPDKEKTHRRRNAIIKYVLIGLVFLLAAGYEGMIIYKYHKLNTALRENVGRVQSELTRVTAVKDEALQTNEKLTAVNLELNNRNNSLSAEIDDYRAISAAKDSRIGALEGDLRVAQARVEAGMAQNMILTNEAEDYGAYIRELTSQLVNSLGEQEMLVNENLRLEQLNKQPNRWLEEKRAAEGAALPEVNNADK